MNCKIRKAQLDEWQQYRQLRLKALKEHPSAFATDYEESKTKDDAYWQGDIESSLKEEDQFMLFAYIEGKMAGMMVVFWKNKSKIKHVANIVGVYVAKQYQD